MPRIDFTARDFPTIMESFRSHLQSKFPNTWKNFYESGIGTAWSELVAYVFDCLSFYLDYTANENFLPTARDRESIIKLCKLIGYKLRQPTGASVVVSAAPTTFPVLPGGVIVVEKGRSVTTSTNLTFVLTSEQRISVADQIAGTGTLTFSEGEVRSEDTVSDGSTWQKIRTGELGVVDGSIAVSVDGTEWTEYTSLVLAAETTEGFSVDYDADGYGIVQFGDGDNGQIPSTGSTITVEYRVGGGVVGNISLGAINTTIQGYLDGAPGTIVNVTVVNDENRGSGGEDAETVAHAKFWAPQWVSTNGRAVTENDFDTLAELFSDATFGAPAFAKARLKQELPELNTVELFVWSRDFENNIAEPSEGLKNALYTYFMNNGEGAVRIICTDVEVLDGNIVHIDIDLTLSVESQYSSAEAVTDVTANLDAFFSDAEANRPGTSVWLSKLYDTIQDSIGVEYALINQITASYETTDVLPAGGALQVAFTDTLIMEEGQPIVEGSVTVEVGAITLVDDGDGVIVGTGGSGTINYATGDITLLFDAAPGIGADIDVTYRYILSYDRNHLITTADGTNNFSGILTYPPVIEYTGTEKGIAFTDGSQTVTDALGDGDLYSGGSLLGTIDYDSGAYRFSFPSAPAIGASIYVAYYQLLRTASEHIPIDKNQIAVKSSYTITTE